MSEETNILKHLELLAVRILEELQGIRNAINDLEYHKVSIDLHKKVEKALKEDDDDFGDDAELLDPEDEFADEGDEEADDEDCDIDDLSEISGKKPKDEEAEHEDWVNFNSDVIGAIIDESDYATDLNTARINKKTIIPTLLVKYGKKWKEKYNVSELTIIKQIKQGIKEIEDCDEL